MLFFKVNFTARTEKQPNKIGFRLFFANFYKFLFNILNSFLMFDLSLLELKGDICHSHSSALAVS